ncbi:alkylhydroperoxidase/carboxymuconolactone decarboxylase family protein YurZ [Psychrobacter sp. PL15]|uniref:AOC03_06830 family ribosome hibernation factor n=1 Tax=Psychrobacter sp. PL15 TaxID=3071719 RepID=UPI002E0C894C|nr:alkylhydroperoxidase/carboxymuconolactone decarboxylase family protein YurZ [Psychrobacter sp. PL15]
MKATLKSLRETKANPAVSIFVKTHREHPENEKDPIALKNQLKVAEERLIKEYDKRTATTILDKIHAEIKELNHNYNLDTLAVFASTDDVQIVRMPIDTVERVVISDRFATRDLVRDMASAVHYYTVVLTRDKARLIEASNDRVVVEMDKDSNSQNHMESIPFPIENNSLYTTGDGGSDRSADNENSYLKEFFNRVDKSVQELWGEHKMPLVIVGDARNISYYQDVCDRPDNIIATVSNLTELEEGNAQHIIDGVQEAVEKYRTSLHEAALSEIDKARGAQMLRTDLQEVYRAAYQGAGETLYVRRGYMQSAKIDETAQTLIMADDTATEGVTDDAIGEIIEHVIHNGGKAVFMPKDIMGEDQPIALVTRY